MPRPERMKSLVETISAALSPVFVIVGGLWVVFQFYSLEKPLSSQLQNKLLEREFQAKPALDIELTAHHFCSIDDDAHLVKVDFMLKNNGNEKMMMIFHNINNPSPTGDRSSFSIYSVGDSGDIEPNWKRIGSFHMPSADSPQYPVNGVMLERNESDRMSTVISVPGPGLYWIAFYARVNGLGENEELPSKNFRGYRKEITSWVAVESRGEKCASSLLGRSLASKTGAEVEADRGAVGRSLL